MADTDDDSVSVNSTVKSEEKEIYNVEKILAERGEGDNVEFLVRWEGYPDERSTWEPRENFLQGDALQKVCRSKVVAYLRIKLI
jgi:hypothetical protein